MQCALSVGWVCNTLQEASVRLCGGLKRLGGVKGHTEGSTA